MHPAWVLLLGLGYHTGCPVSARITQFATWQCPHTHLSRLLVLHSARGTFPDGRHNSYATEVVKVTQQMEANWKITKERKRCQSYFVLEKCNLSGQKGEILLCCVCETLVLQFNAAAADHSSVSQVWSTWWLMCLGQKPFIQIEHMSFVSAARLSAGLWPDWGQFVTSSLGSKSVAGWFSFIVFNQCKSHTGADTAGKLTPPLAAGDFVSVKLSSHMVGCTL